MGLDAFLTIPGVTGSVLKRGAGGKKEIGGQIAVNGLSGGPLAKLESTSGLPQNDTSHSPLVVTKLVDNASTALHTALEKGTVYESATLEFWRMPPAGGDRELYFTIVLTDVQVMGMKTVMLNNRQQENTLVPVQEEVKFCFRRAHYMFKSGGAGSTEPESKNTYSMVRDAEFEIPIVARCKDVPADLAKDFGKALYGEVVTLLKGEETKK